MIQIQAPHQQTIQTSQAPVQQVQIQQPQQQTQVYQQVVTPAGVQNVPIQLTPAQLQAIQMQLQGKQGNQPIIIQSSEQPAVQTIQTVTQADQSQFGQGVYQIQQLPNGQQVYIQQTEVDHSEQDGS